jgi:beta-phosphoglucomutase-like phosphatase (HAD superfamily)
VFDTASDALVAAGRCGTSLPFNGQELHAWTGRLAQERAATSRLLDEIASQEHVHLYRRLSEPRATRHTLGLPNDLTACVFDLDGVLAASGALHAAAWAETFDEFLASRVERTGERFAPFRPFNPKADHFSHIDGKLRLDGVQAFLASRGIRLPEGHAGDPAGAETVHGLANRKNEALRHRLEREGVTAFGGAHAYLEAAREAGIRCAVVSASANTREILERAGLSALIERRVDGNSIRSERFAPKPAPDTMLVACRRLNTVASSAAAFETTVAGVTAARAAGFAFVIAVDRGGRAETLRAHGANLVVPDLAALLEPTASAASTR